MPFFSLVTFCTFSQSLTLFSHFLSIILKAKSTRISKVTTHTKSYGPLSLEAEVEPKNAVDKYAVCIQKSGKVLGHLKKRATGKFKKAIFFFLRSDTSLMAKTVTSGHRCNLGDGAGLQVPCKLKLVGDRKFIDLLQDEFIKLKEI